MYAFEYSLSRLMRLQWKRSFASLHNTAQHSTNVQHGVYTRGYAMLWHVNSRFVDVFVLHTVHAVTTPRSLVRSFSLSLLWPSMSVCVSVMEWKRNVYLSKCVIHIRVLVYDMPFVLCAEVDKMYWEEYTVFILVLRYNLLNIITYKRHAAIESVFFFLLSVATTTEQLSKFETLSWHDVFSNRNKNQHFSLHIPKNNIESHVEY